MLQFVSWRSDSLNGQEEEWKKWHLPQLEDEKSAQGVRRMLSALLSAVLMFPPDPTRDATNLENKIVFLID